MSAISNYIHNSWKNYKEHGRYPNTANKTDYDNTIFNQFQDALVTRSQKGISNLYLENMSNAFNTGRQKALQAMQNLKVKKASYWTQLIAEVIENADLEKTLDAEGVAQVLDINDIGTLELLKGVEKNNIVIRKIRAEKFSWLSTLLKRCNDCRSAIKTIQDQSIQSILLTKVNHIEKQLIKVEQELGNSQSIIKKLTKLNDTGLIVSLADQVEFSRYGKGIIINAPTNQIINEELIAISSIAKLSRVMSNIRGSFDEIIGTIIGPMLDNVENMAIKDIEKAFLSLNGKALGASTSTMGLNPQLGVKLDQKVLKNPEFRRFMRPVIDKDGNEILSLELDYPTKDKADFTISYQGEQLGVSSKAVDLSRDKDYKDPTKEAYLELQGGTNLLAYLLAAERVQSKIGTHFFNVFAVNDANGSEYSALLTSANRAFTTYLLYSALSGDILKASNNVDILYIYDTSKTMHGQSRIHFFSIESILNKIITMTDIEQQKYLTIEPALLNWAKLKEANAYIKGDIGPSISTRLTKVLARARATRYTIGLNHKYIREIIT